MVVDHDLMEKVIMDRRVLHFSDEFTFDIHGRKRMCFGRFTLTHLLLQTLAHLHSSNQNRILSDIEPWHKFPSFTSSANSKYELDS